ncbi:MAG: hypothetical protein D6710_05195 [Nitrospirae bacterium]|nr:MAG: hypothetical protein D6710_05195 [Nitrospirota bacterium]
MEDLEDEERLLAQVRSLLYHILKNLFEEPDKERLRFLKEAFERLSSGPINPSFDNAVGRMRAALNSDGLRDEHYRLFVDPYSDDLIPLTVSMYVEGRNYSKTLLRLREALFRAGLEAAPDIGVPEDYLPFIFEVMELLSLEKSIEIQRDIFRDFIQPVIPELTKRLNEKGGDFYRAVARFLNAFLQLEDDFLNAEGSCYR